MNIWRILNAPFIRWKFTVATDRAWRHMSRGYFYFRGVALMKPEDLRDE